MLGGKMDAAAISSSRMARIPTRKPSTSCRPIRKSSCACPAAAVSIRHSSVTPSWSGRMCSTAMSRCWRRGAHMACGSRTGHTPSTGQRPRSCGLHRRNLLSSCIPLKCLVRIDTPGWDARAIRHPCHLACASRFAPWNVPSESLPVATSLQPYQPPKARCRKVAGNQGRVLGLDAVEDLAAHLRCQCLVHLENHCPIGLGHLRRMEGDITQDQGTLAARHNGQAHVTRRMARRRDGSDFAGQGSLTRDQVEYPQVLQRAEGLFPVLERERSADFWALKGFPIGLVHDIPGPRESRSGVGTPLYKVPTYMVWVQMGEEHCIYIFRRDSRSLQFCHKTAIHATGEHVDHPRIGCVTTGAGIYQDSAPLRTQKVTAVMIAPGVGAAKKLWVALAEGCPRLGRDTWKELT